MATTTTSWNKKLKRYKTCKKRYSNLVFKTIPITFFCFISFLLFVSWCCHSCHILNIILTYILATSFTAFPLKMALCMYKLNIYSFTYKKVVLLFVKTATMFKLLVILFIIKLYAWNDIFKIVKKKQGHNILKSVRKYKKLQPQLLKVLTHIKFIKTCKLGHFIPIFSYLKLAIKNGNLKSKIAHLIMETELQSKKKKKNRKGRSRNILQLPYSSN